MGNDPATPQDEAEQGSSQDNTTPTAQGHEADNFVPEIGQAMFSNTEWQEYELPEWLEAMLRALGDEIERVEWNNNQETFDNPFSNTGNSYETKKFEVNAYCWCDGERHEKGCPPNFKYKPTSFIVNWYKYLGRGSSMNQPITPTNAAEMFADCMASIRAKESIT